MKEILFSAAGIAAKCVGLFTGMVPENLHVCLVVLFGLIAVFTAPLGVLCGIAGVVLGAGYFLRDKRKYGWLVKILIIMCIIGIFI
ncbi:MAG: hypothetical protein LUE14_07885 [Clostridiales bacterium]|nr:hypothetical protein [Clostridiales bacterium]